jgi:hypothetical protein
MSTTTFVLAVAAVVIACLNMAGLGAGLSTGFLLRMSTTRDSIITLRANATLLEARLNTIQSGLIESVANVDDLVPLVTPIQDGTYVITLFGDEDDSNGSGTYRLENVELGPLSFTLLHIDSPSVPAAWDLFEPDGTYYGFIRNFIPPFYSCCANNVLRHMTPANLARLAISTNGTIATARGEFGSESYGFVLNFVVTASSDAAPSTSTALLFTSPLQVVVPFV